MSRRYPLPSRLNEGGAAFRQPFIGYRSRVAPWIPRAILLAIARLVAGCGGSDEAATTVNPGEIAFELDSASDAQVSGVRATLSYEDRDRTTIRVDGLDEGGNAGGGPNPVQLTRGTCDDPGEMVFELENLSGPTSETTVDLGLVALQNGEYAVQVGLTQDQPEIIACGEIPQESPDQESDS